MECVVAVKLMMMMMLMLVVAVCPVELRRRPSVDHTRQVVTTRVAVVPPAVPHQLTVASQRELRLVCHTIDRPISLVLNIL